MLIVLMYTEAVTGLSAALPCPEQENKGSHHIERVQARAITPQTKLTSGKAKPMVREANRQQSDKQTVSMQNCFDAWQTMHVTLA